MLCGIVRSADGMDTSFSVVDTVVSGTERVRNPFLCAALSAAVPGAGQFYTRHYVKGTAFILLEAISGSMAGYWYRTMNERMDEADEYEEVFELATEWNDRALKAEEWALKRSEVRSARYSMYNALSIFVGGYVYNILDAVEKSGRFVSDEKRNPAVAGSLAAIPGFGLGQMYNGAFSKAGMVMMVQSGLVVKAYNEHRLMKRAEAHHELALAIVDSAGKAFVADKWNVDWESRRKTAFRNRNSFLWYSLFFYMYGILDAVVDAHLHDYPRKMRAYPDLVPQLSAVGLSFEYRF